MFNAWSGSLDSIVPQDKFSVSYCGWIGFASTMAQIVTACLMGQIIDRVPKLQRRMKTTLIALLVFTSAIMAWTTLALPLGISGTTGKQPAPLIDQGIGVTGFAIILYGAVLGATSPLFFEFGVELTYPAPEALSSGRFCDFPFPPLACLDLPSFSDSILLTSFFAIFLILFCRA